MSDLAAALDIVGARWALLVVERLLDGPQRYELLLTTEQPTGEPTGPTSFLPGEVELPARTVWLMRVLRRV